MPRRSRSRCTDPGGLPVNLRVALGRLHDLVLILEPVRNPGRVTNDFLVAEASAGSAGLLGVAGESLRGGTLANVLGSTRFPLSLGACHRVASSGEDHLYEDDYRLKDGTTR